jgi:FGGY-family pentulose kinase
MNFEYVIGVDVGTGSVRAGVFDLEGSMVGHAVREIQIWRPQEDFVEQSSTDIWARTGEAVREAVARAGIHPSTVAGLSFDATCSLVALDVSLAPITVSPTGKTEQNVIVWMDHRAVNQARRINATRHPMLKYVGGVISPEMEPPKLLWLKENLQQTWKKTAKFFDLADFLVFQATGQDLRSLCTTVCKWAYDGKNGRWDPTFYRHLGMEDLITKNKIGDRILPMGSLAGDLTPAAASHLGLTTATKVAVGIIDAHAGGIGVMGMGFTSTPKPASLERVLALIGGTSSCHMAVSRSPHFIKGIWGPYKSAMIPGLWLTEGGQTATGALLDFIFHATGRSEIISADARGRGVSVYEYLNSVVSDIKQRDMEGPAIVKDLHVLPYFLGNRSPHADPTARGIISGLALDDSIDAVARLYYATIQAIAYGTRHIIEEMNNNGYAIKRIHACGGGTRNSLWLQEHADITGCEIVLPREPEAVLLGTAILAAVGAGKFPSIMDAAIRMSSAGQRFQPRKKHARFHTAKYRVFRKMYQHLRWYQKTMERF